MHVGDPRIEIFALLARIADELDLPMSTFFQKPRRNPASEAELRELVDLYLDIEDPLLQGQMMSLFRTLAAKRQAPDPPEHRA